MSAPSGPSGQEPHPHHIDSLTDSVYDLFARAQSMGASGQFMVLITDPETGMAAHGPFPGPQAVGVAEELRANFDSTSGMAPGDDISNCKIDLVPWSEWP